MKGKWILSTVLTGALVITGCSNNDTKNEDNEANKENKKSQSAKSSNDVKSERWSERDICKCRCDQW